MKYSLKRALRWAAVCVFLSIPVGIVLFLQCLREERLLSKIVPNGPFSLGFPAFDGSQTYGIIRKEDVERWILEAVPLGSSREQARQVLRASFTVDLASGRPVTIYSLSSFAGGESTSVRLVFDDHERLIAIEVEQQSAYL